MNRVFIIFKDGKVFGVRSTATIADAFVKMEQSYSKKAKFTIEEWEVPR